MSIYDGHLWVEGSKIKHRILCRQICQEDKAVTQFVRLTDDFCTKQDAVDWIESIMEEVADRKEG